MPILSLPGSLATYIAFGRAKVWRSVLLLGLIFSPFAARAMCAAQVVNDPERNILINATRFIDLEVIAKASKPELMKKVTPYIALELKLEDELNEINDENYELAKVNTADRDQGAMKELSDRMTRTQTELSLVRNYLELIERLSLKKFQFSPTPVLQRLVVHGWSVDIQVMSRMIESLKDLGKPKVKLIVRFIPIAKQDVTLEHGTDLYGKPFLDEGENISQGNFINERMAVLKFNNLRMHDGFEGLTLPNAANYRQILEPSAVKSEGTRPHHDVEKFMKGEMAIAIYDADQLDEPDDEYFIFKKPQERKKALLRLIIPVKG